MDVEVVVDVPWWAARWFESIAMTLLATMRAMTKALLFFGMTMYWPKIALERPANTRKLQESFRVSLLPGNIHVVEPNRRASSMAGELSMVKWWLNNGSRYIDENKAIKRGCRRACEFVVDNRLRDEAKSRFDLLPRSQTEKITEVPFRVDAHCECCFCTGKVNWSQSSWCVR